MVLLVDGGGFSRGFSDLAKSLNPPKSPKLTCPSFLNPSATPLKIRLIARSAESSGRFVSRATFSIKLVFFAHRN